MECPVCGAVLPPLDALLAQTRWGTQCPKCWSRLKNLSAPVTELRTKARAKSEPPRRKAA